MFADKWKYTTDRNILIMDSKEKSYWFLLFSVVLKQIKNWSRQLTLLVPWVCVGCRLSSWFIQCQNVCWEPLDRRGLRGSQGGLLTAEKQCQSRSQTTGERLRSQARLIDILTYCTFPERGLPWGKHYCLTAPSPGFEPLNVKHISGEAQQWLIRPVRLRGGRLT